MKKGILERIETESKIETPERISITFRLTPDQHSKLTQLSKYFGKAQNWLVGKLVDGAFSDLEQRLRK